MKVSLTFNLDELSKLLLGINILPGVNPWRSQIRALSRAITFVENDPLLGTQLLSCPVLSKSFAQMPRVVGITGLPGAGKSTLTNILVKELRAQGQKVAVFAVDPSSTLSGGAILGDRVRMQDHFHDEGVFIRSMGSRGALGGLAKATRSAIRLASFLGFDFILVETVGIGQNESAIVDLADTSVLVLMPNSGDEIQLMKAGVLQLANIYVINKCDLADTSRMIQELKENVSHPLKKDSLQSEQEWMPPILKTSALRDQGVCDLSQAIMQHKRYEKSHPLGKDIMFARLRREVLQNMLQITEERLKDKIEKINFNEWEDLLQGKCTTMAIAQRMLKEEVFN